ncbi:MAG: hypothetical protein AAFR87_03635 [Bacteroidota bacterium]
MDAYTLELKKLLANNEVKEVMNSLIETLDEAAKYSSELKEEITPLQGKIIVFSGNLSRIISERDQDLIDYDDFSTRMARVNKSLVDTLNSLEEEYPLLEAYFNERTEEKAWAIASAANDIESYQDYFQKYPNGKYKEETQRLIRELQAIEAKRKAEFRKKAEAEKKRRQSVHPKPQPKTRTSNLRYYLMGVGLLAAIALGYVLITKSQDTKTERTRAEVAITEVEETKETENSNPRDPGKTQTDPDTKEPENSRNPGGTLTLEPSKVNPEILEKLPELVESGKIPVDRLIKSVASAWQGSWSTNYNVLRLKTSGNRVYGDYGMIGTIEGYYDPASQTLKGEFVNGLREGSFKWVISGEKMGGIWSFNDSKTSARWTGEKTSSRSPTLQNFPWEGIWDTKVWGQIQMYQKGNKVSGKGDYIYFSNAAYDVKRKLLTGVLVDKKNKTSVKFSMNYDGKSYFKGEWAYTDKVPKGAKSSGTWSGKRIK